MNRQWVALTRHAPYEVTLGKYQRESLSFKGCRAFGAARKLATSEGSCRGDQKNPRGVSPSKICKGPSGGTRRHTEQIPLSGDFSGQIPSGS
jgi:hypothetical protein